ncbi:MAG: ABC-F family ATP-binding cassette domain-containing protein [Alphaproteobacteria bacterium]|nr:ABC-F family ATP-binding cassette domain-containing protein [Alphaproteobacteria bacterium]
MIKLEDVTIQIGFQELLNNAHLFVPDGAKVGFVGANGCGKSTLFKVLTNKLEASGSVEISSFERIAFVEQEIENPHLTVKEYVLQKDKYLSKAYELYETALDSKKAEAYEEVKRLGGETVDARISSVLKGLGFQEEDFFRPVSEFSGGWQMRLNLAGALFQPSTLLLLDEPTNHLDLESVIWLQNFLKKYKGTLLLISHDKHILNEICDKIVVFENKKLLTYSGNYDTYLTTKATQNKVLERQIQKDAAKKEHLMAFVNRFRYKASKAKQAQSRLKLLEKMQELPALCLDKEEHFSFLETTKAVPPLIKAEGVQLGYDDKVVLNNVSFSLAENERIALLGQNGNGKSTLAKFIAGVLTAQKGSVHFWDNLKIGYFSQHQEEELPLSETPISYFESLMNGAHQTAIRSHLATFGLTGEKALTQIQKLSGGEKSRLLFAKMALKKPHLLILDEPTNHLDIKGRSALAMALNEYKGSIILITHDFQLIQEVAETLWLVKEGKCTPFDGDLEEYKQLLLTPFVDKKQEKALLKEKQERQAQKEAKKLLNANKRKIKADILALERALAQLNKEKEEFEKKFESPLTPDEILEITKKITSIQKEIDVLEEKWFSLSEMLEE